MKTNYFKVTWMTNGRRFRRYFPTVELARKKRLELNGSKRPHHCVTIWEVERCEYGVNMVERVIRQV